MTVLCAGGSVGAAPTAAVPTPVPNYVWRTVRGLGPMGGVRDVAVESGGRLALADAQGVVIVTDGPMALAAESPVRVQRIARLGAATRVRFDGRGGLFAVGEQGLLHVDEAGRSRDRTPWVGQGARALVALDARDGWLAVGGEGGLFVARTIGAVPESTEWQDGRDWLRVHDGLAPGRVTDVAFGPRSQASGRPLWVVVDGALHIVWLDLEGAGIVASPARRQRIPGRPISEPVLRVIAPGPGSDVRVLYRRAIARPVGPPLAAAVDDAARWEIVFPVLPPEAELTGVVRVDGRTWLASTAGVLAGSERRARFERVTAPAGGRPTVAVAAAGDRVLAASAAELLRGEPAPYTERVRATSDRMPRDPELARVHRRTLERLGLEPREIDRLWRGLRRRGWLPSVTLHGGVDYGSGQTRDYDESFSYGQLNRLNDRNWDRSTGYDARIALSWDFADLAYSPEAVDLSREARQVIGLRDNVLDEINQLYFDRQRALRALSAYADWSDPEAASLRLRALELAAGLDAWTGGWFSSHVELPAAARAAWRGAPMRPAEPRAIPIHHPATPVPTHAGRDDS